MLTRQTLQRPAGIWAGCQKPQKKRREGEGVVPRGGGGRCQPVVPPPTTISFNHPKHPQPTLPSRSPTLLDGVAPAATGCRRRRARPAVYCKQAQPLTAAPDSSRRRRSENQGSKTDRTTDAAAREGRRRRWRSSGRLMWVQRFSSHL